MPAHKLRTGRKHVILGNHIRKLRKAQEKTLEELADEVGTSSSYMGKIERGERNITAEKIFKIAEALDVCPSEFFKLIPKT